MKRRIWCPGTAWVCCWLLGWQAAALQLPPCEEVRFCFFFPFSLLWGFGRRSGWDAGEHPIYVCVWDVAGYCRPVGAARGVGLEEMGPPVVLSM